MQQPKEELPPLSASDLAAQRAAHAALRRRMVFSFLGFLAYITAFVSLQIYVPGGLPGWLFVLLLLFPLTFLLILYRQQWTVLAIYQLRCPSCRALLAASPRIFASPTPFCARCGKLALYPSKLLTRRDGVT